MNATGSLAASLAPEFDTTYLTVMAFGGLSQLAALLVVVRYGGKKLAMTALVTVLASWLAIALPMARLIGSAT